jgi:hypothetical protein
MGPCSELPAAAFQTRDEPGRLARLTTAPLADTRCGGHYD